MSGDVQAKLSLSLDEIAKQQRADGQKESRGTGRGRSGGKSGKSGKGGGSRKSDKGRGGARPATGDTNAGWRKHVHVEKEAETGDTVVWLYKTDVVRIGTDDIVVQNGGFRSTVTLTCINEALAPYTFQLYESGDEWYVTDSKFRLIRLAEGRAVITGGVHEKRQPVPNASPTAAGPQRVVRASKGRHQPY